MEMDVRSSQELCIKTEGVEKLVTISGTVVGAHLGTGKTLSRKVCLPYSILIE